MSTSVRVRRLAVRAAERESGAALRPRLEDALRVTSLPGDGEGRLVFVRRLRLQGVRRDASAQSLAAQIERAARIERGTLVHGEAAHAAAADAVWFADRAEAVAALFVRLVRAEPADAWYWPLVFPELRLHAAPERARRLAAVALRPGWSADRGWALRCAAAFALEVARRGAVAELAAVLPAREAETLIAEYGWSTEAAPDARDVARVSFAPNGVAELADGEEAQPGPVLVLSLLACAADPASAQCRSLPAVARRALSEARAARWGPRLPRAREFDNGRIHVRPAALAAVRPADAETPEVPPFPKSDAASVRDVWHVTRAAGLLFLLPMLERLGDRLDATTPAAGEGVGVPIGGAIDVRYVLSCCLKWMRVPAADAAWLLVGLEEMGADQTDVTGAAQAWLRRLRMWGVRNLRMSLRRLVLRGGRVSVSLTHADVELPLASIDIRIRRVGLDLDPGWVAAYGRVVRFHYR